MALFTNLGGVSTVQNTSLFGQQNPQLQTQQQQVQKDVEVYLLII